MKLYQITDLSQLERVREWVFNPHNRSHLIESYPNGSVYYQVTVDDPIGMISFTDAFEREFSGVVEVMAWPK